MLRWIVSICLLLFMTGCSSRWEHATKRPSEFSADDRECQLLTGGVNQTVEPGRGERLSYESCMWERGWRKTNVIWFFNPTPKD